MREFWVQSNTNGLKKSIDYSFTPSFTAREAFFYIQSAGYFQCDENYFTRRSGYRSFLLIYTLSGKGYAKYRDRKYEIKKDQILLLDCYDLQEYFTDKTELWEFKFIHFNGSSSEQYYKYIYNNFGPVVDLQDNSNLIFSVGSILDLAENRDVQMEIKASGIIASILTEIILNASVVYGDLQCRRSNEKVDSVLRYIETNYESKMQLSDMAAIAFCSQFHLVKIFKRVTGYSPYEYLVKFRISKAKELLKMTDKTVEEIAESIGFQSISNFIKTFKELEEITPLKYRKYWME